MIKRMTQHQMETRAWLYANISWWGVILLIAISVAVVSAFLHIWPIISGLITGAIVYSIQRTQWYTNSMDAAEALFLMRIKESQRRKLNA